MEVKNQEEIFKKGGKTFYYSSLFFPKEIRDKVAVLYAFLRTVDDLVDEIPPKKTDYDVFKEEYYKTLKSGQSKNYLIESFVNLKNEVFIKDEWVDSLFLSMEMDLYNSEYESIHDTLKYIYGVAEVVGFMMARILDLEEALHYAGIFGRAGQYANMLRDIAEDLNLGRIYMPKNDLEMFNLKNLDLNYVKENKENFIKFMEFQLGRHDAWLIEAESGYKFIPKKYRVTVKTAGDLYNHWTMQEIRRDPFIIYEKSVKPSKSRVLLTGFRNLLSLK